MNRRPAATGLASILAAGTLLAACSVTPDQTGRRGPTPLGDQYYLNGPTSLSVEVQSCHGEPAVSTFEEIGTTVRIEVVSTTYREGNDCQDRITVDLEQPLDDRSVVDLTTGDNLVPG